MQLPLPFFIASKNATITHPPFYGDKEGRIHQVFFIDWKNEKYSSSWVLYSPPFYRHTERRITLSFCRADRTNSNLICLSLRPITNQGQRWPQGKRIETAFFAKTGEGCISRYQRGVPPLRLDDGLPLSAWGWPQDCSAKTLPFQIGQRYNRIRGTMKAVPKRTDGGGAP